MLISVQSVFNFIILEIIYRPFFNILVLFYQILPWKDMGIALSVFTVLLSLLLLPLSLAGEQTEDERRQLLRELKEVEERFQGYPVRIQQEKDRIIRSHRRVINIRYLSYLVYVVYFVILYRIFKTGLKGEDLDLLYSSVPQPEQPLNLVFLGVLELTRPNPLFNAISAVLVFVAETLGIWFSSLPPTRDDRLAQVLTPLAAFFITYRIPAGQELFFTVSLLFAIVMMLVRESFALVRDFLDKKRKRHRYG